MIHGLLNVGSLALGLISWILPVAYLVRREMTGCNDWRAFSLPSVTACALSLCMQIVYQNHLVDIEDWSALMDTSDASAFLSALLLTVTIALNAIAGFTSRRE